MGFSDTAQQNDEWTYDMALIECVVSICFGLAIINHSPLNVSG